MKLKGPLSDKLDPESWYGEGTPTNTNGARPSKTPNKEKWYWSMISGFKDRWKTTSSGYADSKMDGASNVEQTVSSTVPDASTSSTSISGASRAASIIIHEVVPVEHGVIDALQDQHVLAEVKPRVVTMLFDMTFELIKVVRS